MLQSVEISTADMDSVFPAAEGLTHDLTFHRLCKISTARRVSA